MTYEELKQIREKARDIENEAFRMKNEAALQYINERVPFPFKWYENIIIHLEVTEATRKMLTDDGRRMKKYALGRRYTKKGKIIGWYIADDGEIRPRLYGMNGSYSRYDKIHLVEQDEQDPRRCRDCELCRADGHCYNTGHPTEPTRRNVLDSYICGYFRPKKI